MSFRTLARFRRFTFLVGSPFAALALAALTLESGSYAGALLIGGFWAAAVQVCHDGEGARVGLCFRFQLTMSLPSGVATR